MTTTAISGPLTLYVWQTRTMRRRNPMMFRAAPENGEYPVAVAEFRVEAELKAGHSLRIENAAGEVVFLATKGRVEFPVDVAQFWKECGR